MQILKKPELIPYREIELRESKIILHNPQIVSGMAMIPIITESLNIDHPEIIEESMLNKEIYLIDDAGGYDRLSIQNTGDNDVIIPAATHITGGHQNRGNDKIQLLTNNQKIRIDAHCFEPSRSSGPDNFNGISETPIDIVFKTMTSHGTGASWEAIGEYTKILSHSRDSLLSFIQGSDQDRLHLSLNYETYKKQTGVLSVFDNEVVAIEIFPNAKTFNRERDQIYKGKFASLLFKYIRTKGHPPQLTPRDVAINIDNFFEKVKFEGNPIQRGNYHILSKQESNFVADMVFNQYNKICYMFAMQKI